MEKETEVRKQEKQNIREKRYLMKYKMGEKSVKVNIKYTVRQG
jgi:hypothetical protein